MRFLLVLFFMSTGVAIVLGQDNTSPPFKDQGIWNEFHQNNLGKFVFSNEKIIHNSPDANLVRDTFDLTKPIKARLYLDKSLANKCAELEASGLYEKDAFNYSLHKKIDLSAAIQIGSDQPIIFTLPLIESYAQKEQWTTWWYSLIPDEPVSWKSYPENALEYVFGKAVSTLAAGTYHVKIDISMRALNPKVQVHIPLVNGSFILAFSENDRKVWFNKMQYIEPDSPDDANQSDTEIASEYVTFKNNCSEKLDIEYDSNGTTYSNTFIPSGGQIEFRMRTGDQLRTKNGALLYTHTYGGSTTIYLCN